MKLSGHKTRGAFDRDVMSDEDLREASNRFADSTPRDRSSEARPARSLAIQHGEVAERLKAAFCYVSDRAAAAIEV
jgi:hypothetical protein